jgi:ATP-dependent Clp protease protease subunit
MKNYISDFRGFAIDKVDIKPTVIDSQIKNMITPTVVEERKLNAVVYDVFSRLMLDRIIFL